MPRWMPNALSGLRIALVPLWLVMAERHRDALLADGEGFQRTLLILLLLLGFSDLVDGWLARRHGLETEIGAMLDASADKLAQVAMFTWLAFRDAPGLHPVPLWFWVLLPLRDLILLTGWACIRRHRGRVDSNHRWHGKGASLLLFALLVGVMAGAPGAVLDIGYATVALAVGASTMAYVVDGRRQMNAEPS